MNTNPNLIEFSATAFRPKDDNTLDSLTASISFPADKENDVMLRLWTMRTWLPMSLVRCMTSLFTCVPTGWTTKIPA